LSSSDSGRVPVVLHYAGLVPIGYAVAVFYILKLSHNMAVIFLRSELGNLVLTEEELEFIMEEQKKV
jgi:hypothetical protein